LRLAELVLLLLKVAVGTADEGLGIIELAVEIFPFLYVLNLDVHGERLGHKLDLMAETFDQDSSVPLHFIKALINRFDPPVNPFEPPIVPV